MVNAIAHFLSRRQFDTIRVNDELIRALVRVTVVGLGPCAGVLAVLTPDLGTPGQMFSTAIEAADRRRIEGVISAAGGGIGPVACVSTS